MATLVLTVGGESDICRADSGRKCILGRVDYRVPRYNYTAQFSDVDGVAQRLRDCLVSGRYVLSTEVVTFERDFAAYIGASHALGVNSGTDALTLALAGIGIGPGDEVVTVANTFHASVLPIVRLGARPVLVDCRSSDYLMDADQAAAAITPRTRAILVVHLFGAVVDLQPYLELAGRHCLHVIEDCCQAHGATWRGRRVGSVGTAGCFSFHPSKNLAAAGDCGMITTSDDELATRLARLRHLGQDGQNNHVTVGWNTKLDALQAVVLAHKLPNLDGWNELRQGVAARYRAELASLPVEFQRPPDGTDHVYHLFQLRTPRRDELLRHLCAAGVDAVVRYPTPVHLQPAFPDLPYERGAFPNAEMQASQTLCLPIRPDLTEDDVAFVCDAVRGFHRDRVGAP